MIRVLEGDALTQLATLPAESVQCVVTSPPYWGLRSYGGDAGMIGLEPTLEEHIANLVAVFREVWRVLRKDGTVWLNYGDAYSGQGGKQNAAAKEVLKAKDLMMLPARVALALQAAGWWLRSEIIWAKPNPMPESVTDRPTNAHEKIFLLSKAARYFYDAEAVRTDSDRFDRGKPRQGTMGGGDTGMDGRPARQYSGGGFKPRAPERNGDSGKRPPDSAGANMRNVWTIATFSYPESHFATFPPKLVEPCIKAGTSEKGCCVACGSPRARVVDVDYTPNKRGRVNRQDGGDSLTKAPDLERKDKHVTTTGWQPTCECNAETQPCQVLDPFGGAGTVGLVADRLGRNAILIEINADYAEMARQRITKDAPLFARVA